MNPQTTPQVPGTPPSGAVSQPQKPVLDPSIVALTKAIGKAETGGNYNAPKGKAGEIGAYQMTPQFIANYAPKHLQNYDPNNLTPEQQDQLAYGVIKDWGTAGDQSYSHLGPLKPAQVASAWNAGDPNAYLDSSYGKNNNYGSVENYVKKVGDYYQQQREGGSSSVSPNQNQQPKSDQLSPGGANSLSAENSPLSSDLKSSTPNLDTALFLGGAGLAAFAPEIAGIGSAITGGIGGAIKTAAPYLTGAAEAKGVLDFLGGNRDTSQAAAQTSQSPSIASLMALESEMPQAQQSSQALSQTLLQALQATPTGRVLAQDPGIQESLQSNAKYGLAPEIHNGNMDFSAASKKSDSLIRDMSNNVSEILQKEGASAPMKEAINEANKYIDKFVPDAQREEARGYVREQIQKYYKENGGKGGVMNLGEFHRMKSQEGHGKKWGLLESTARKAGAKALSIGARRTIENHTKHKDFYNAIMKEETNLIRGQKLMKRLNGKKAPHHESLKKTLLHEGGRLMGIFVGDKIGGPLGSVMGNLIANRIIRAVDKKHGRTLFETPEMRHSIQLLKSKSPAVYEVMKRELEKAGIKEEGKKLVDIDGVQKIPNEKGLLKKILKNKSTLRNKPSTPKYRTQSKSPKARR